MKKAVSVLFVLLMSSGVFALEQEESYNGFDFVCEKRYEVGSNSFDICELLNKYFVTGYVMGVAYSMEGIMDKARLERVLSMSSRLDKIDVTNDEVFEAVKSYYKAGDMDKDVYSVLSDVIDKKLKPESSDIRKAKKIIGGK